MRTVPNMFVASLAVSDFSTGIFFKHFIVLFGNSFKMAFWRCNVPISRLFIINFGINLGSHNGIDGGEQILSNRQTRKVPTTFYQDEDQDNDCCAWIYITQRPLLCCSCSVVGKNWCTIPSRISAILTSSEAAVHFQPSDWYFTQLFQAA